MRIGGEQGRWQTWTDHPEEDGWTFHVYAGPFALHWTPARETRYQRWTIMFDWGPFHYLR